MQRCRALVHVIDGTSRDPIGDYKAIRLELELFNPQIAEKPQVGGGRGLHVFGGWGGQWGVGVREGPGSGGMGMAKAGVRRGDVGRWEEEGRHRGGVPLGWARVAA